MEKTERYFACEVRAEQDEQHGTYITGRPIVFGEATDMCGCYAEIIDRGALDNTDMRDVRLLVGHNTSMIPLARSRRNNANSTMQLQVDANGMPIRANLDTENNAEARALYSATQRGDISGMSFMFTIDAVEWENLDSDYPTRHIKSIGKIFEVSAVAFPAYEQTTLEARAAEALERAKAALESARESRKKEPVHSEDIFNMTLAEVEARMADTAPGSEEMINLEERKAELEAIERRSAYAAALTNGSAKPEKIIEDRKEENTMETVITRESPEYRSAFLNMLVGRATPEQRAIFADNTNYGDGIGLPVAIDNAIWDQVCSEHPILADIEVVRSGIVMKVPQITPTVPASKKDSTTTSELTYTTAEVTLAGKDYHTYIKLSYAEATMSQNALERYLIDEISAVLSESMAKDVFARILADVGSAAATKASGNTYFSCLTAALGAAKLATKPVVYAPASLYYAMLGEVDTNGQPIFRNGLLLGAEFKMDNAATKITVVDPKRFLMNVAQDVTVKSQESVTDACFYVGGYARAEGCLRVKAAAAYVG